MDCTQKDVEAADAAKSALIIPTLNGGRHLGRLIAEIRSLDPAPATIVVIDSCSDDDSLAQAQAAGFRTHSIPRKDFDHGGTRNLAASLVPDAEFLIFLTQDALPAGPGLVRELLAPFVDPQVAMVYARQLPHAGASVAARFSRHHRYPATSFRRTLADAKRLGAMAAFCSNACAAYRRSDYESVGRFPVGFPLGEDMSIAAGFLQAGRAIVYEARAEVFHSHDYDWMQEFSRYFDIGTHHRMDPWLREEGIKVGGEGYAYLVQEVDYTWKAGGIADLPAIVPRLGARWLGYRIGYHLSGRLPCWLSKRLSMHGFCLHRDATCEN